MFDPLRAGRHPQRLDRVDPERFDDRGVGRLVGGHASQHRGIGVPSHPSSRRRIRNGSDLGGSSHLPGMNSSGDDQQLAREHIMRRALLLTATAVLALATSLTASATAGTTPTSTSAPAKAGQLKLPGGFKHLVVIYLENHSFDNLYGGWGSVNGQPVDGLDGL